MRIHWIKKAKFSFRVLLLYKHEHIWRVPNHHQCIFKWQQKDFRDNKIKRRQKIYSGQNKIGGDKKVKRQEKNKAATKRVRRHQKTIIRKPRRAIHSHSIFFVAALLFNCRHFIFFLATFFLRRFIFPPPIKLQ